MIGQCSLHKIRPAWLRHGFWNVLENSLTRAADAATSFVLLWTLNPEIFSKLAVAQAMVAPALLLFIAPETVIYREFASWKQASVSYVAGHLRAFRLFAFFKVALAILLASLMAFLSDDWSTAFWALMWAFTLALSPQVSGPDREFLRLNLQLKELSAITLLQKLSLLGGTILCSILFPKRIDLLAVTALLSGAITTFVAYKCSRRTLIALGANRPNLAKESVPSVFEILFSSIGNFSLWNHLMGVIMGWVQTMDLFFLGMWKFPAREMGLYAAALKLANLSTALPTALANTFLVWIGRRAQPNLDPKEIKSVFRRGLLGMSTAVLLQALILLLIAPYLINMLSHGRWSDPEQAMVMDWFNWILAGSSLFALAWPAVSWLILRADIKGLLVSLYLPWGMMSAGIYAALIYWKGFHGAAITNVLVSALYLVMLRLHFWKIGRKGNLKRAHALASMVQK